MQRKTLILLLMLILTALYLTACVSTQGLQRTDQITSVETEFDCKQPEGREYICYSDEECIEYVKGYVGVLKHRIFMQKKYEWYKGVKTHTTHINLWMDHKNTLMVGIMSLTPVGKEKTFEISTEMYDMDCNLIHKAHKKETSGAKI